MDRLKIVLLSLAVVALAGLAVLAAFSFTTRTSTTIANLPLQQTVQAVRQQSAAAPSSAPRATRNAADQEHLNNLEFELSELPREEELTGNLSAQVEGIRQLRSRMSALQAALSRNYGKLMAETAAATFGREDNLGFDLAITELQQKLGTAKDAVVSQQQVLNKFEGSDSTDITRGFQAELVRRQRVVTELEQDIADLVLERQERANLKNARQAARLRAWRSERNVLENEYSGAADALERALRNYELMIRNAGETRQRSKQIEDEQNRIRAR